MAISRVTRLISAPENAQMYQIYLKKNDILVDQNNVINGGFAGEVRKINGNSYEILSPNVDYTVTFAWSGGSYISPLFVGKTFLCNYPLGSTWSLSLGHSITIIVERQEQGESVELTRHTITPAFQGSQGSAGPIFYPAGKWDSTTTYSSTSTKQPYVMYGKNYYYLKSYVTVTGGPDPATSYAAGGNWVLMDNLKVAIAEAVIADFGKMGAAVFYGDYMYSQYGIDVDGDVSSHYELFAPSTDPYLETNPFRPNVCIDLKNGIIWCGCGKTKLNFDGSGYLAGGNISWDSNGNATVEGVIKALMLYNPSIAPVPYIAGRHLNPITDGSTYIVYDTRIGDEGFFILPSAEDYNGLEYTFYTPNVTPRSVPIHISAIEYERIFLISNNGQINNLFCNKITGFGVIKLRATQMDTLYCWVSESIIGSFTEDN